MNISDNITESVYISVQPRQYEENKKYFDERLI